MSVESAVVRAQVIAPLVCLLPWKPQLWTEAVKQPTQITVEHPTGNGSAKKTSAGLESRWWKPEIQGHPATPELQLLYLPSSFGRKERSWGTMVKCPNSEVLRYFLDTPQPISGAPTTLSSSDIYCPATLFGTLFMAILWTCVWESRLLEFGVGFLSSRIANHGPRYCQRNVARGKSLHQTAEQQNIRKQEWSLSKSHMNMKIKQKPNFRTLFYHVPTIF